MKKRWLCGTMALVIGAMAMAGCSGGNSSSSASAAGTEAADSGSSRYFRSGDDDPCSTCMWNRFSV